MAALILVVDDDDDLRNALVETIADRGYQVAEAKDGRQALEYLGGHPLPKLILADMTMPPGSTRAGPPAELLKPSHRLTTAPFMSMTSTAWVPSGESTVNPFHDRSGS